MPANHGNKPPAGSYRLYIRGLELPIRVGVHRFEQHAPQRVRVDVTLWVSRSGDAADDRLGQVVDYEAIVEAIRALSEDRHIHLLETLADRVANACLHDPRVHGAVIRIEKPDIFPDAAAAGVEVERWRP